MTDVILLPHLNTEVASEVKGFKLDAYLVALEGWRRGLELKYYKDESPVCKLHTLNTSTTEKFFSLSSGRHHHFFFRSRGDKVSNKSVNLCQSKEKTKTFMRKKGINVPDGRIFSVNDGDITEYAKTLGYPVIIKPINGSMGKGVYTNLNDEFELQGALNEFSNQFKTKRVLMEKHYYGKEYRIYVVGNKVIGAINRVPANVLGNGESSIKTLIRQKNADRKRNPYLSKKPIRIDYEIKKLLDSLGYTLDSIPPEGEQIFLREKSNLSSGGDPIDATNALSQEVKSLAVEALKTLPGIPHAGVDVIVNPDNVKIGTVIEVNATAEIAFHMFPIEGKARDIPKAIIDYYFPETEGKKKANWYFNLSSVRDPLKKWAVDELTIANPPSNYIYGKKLIVYGKVKNVGYMSWIKRQALKNCLHGNVKMLNNNVEIELYGNDEENIMNFKKLCYKGTKKSNVKNIELYSIKKEEKLMPMGFHIIN